MTLAIPRITDGWQDLTEIGRTLAEAADRNRWAMGELAQRVKTTYGDNSLGKFASEINVRGKTLYEYRRVYSYYATSSTRAENLSWSHYREAMRMDGLDKSEWALEKAATRGWTIERMGMILSRYLKGRSTSPDKMLDAIGDVVSADANNGYITLRLAAGFDPFDLSKLIGHTTQVKLYKVAS